MSRVLRGFLQSLAASTGFCLLFSLVICLGADPETRLVSDGASPLLGIWTGAYFASRAGSWRIGAGVAVLYVAVWFGFWMYVMGRWNPELWLEEGAPRLTISHCVWWGAAILAGGLGGTMARFRVSLFAVVSGFAILGLVTFMLATERDVLPISPVRGFQVVRQGPTADGTTAYTMTFDFHEEPGFRMGIYDCDQDDAKPDDDFNTTYMGQSLAGVIDKVSRRAEPDHRQVLCVLNGGFFGASGFAVAHHEEPLVEHGHALYDVDLLRPKDQSCFFAVNSSEEVKAGQSRFSMPSSIPRERLGDYQTVLGGVRPLLIGGNSLQLKPGAGATTLRCSRTSVGWSLDGNTFSILIVRDPDGEMASQIQRRMGTQTGGWDVREVQKFWEEKGVPFAVLFDGGESTQLAFREARGGCAELLSGYQYSFTIGYLFQRPLRFTLPILPPDEGHRGVLNYLYVTGPRK